jgi:hypothetical protein
MHNYFFRKQRSASPFRQKKIKHLTHSADKNKVPHYFFLKKLIFYEEIMRRWIFVLNNNVALHFFEGIMRHLIFSERIMRHHFF